VIDSDSKIIKEKAAALTEKCNSQKEKAIVLFYYVRDEIFYTPLPDSFSITEYRASKTLRRGEGYCTQKAILLTALARAAHIQSRLGFADVINHRIPEELFEKMGTNKFVYHGYSELWLNNRWVRATPAFNKELCNKLDIKPVEFDGEKDAVFHKRDKKGRTHVKYVKYYGSYTDIPYDEMMQAFKEEYAKMNG